MRSKIIFLLLFSFMPLMGMSCADGDEYIVQGAKINKVKEAHSTWAELNRMSIFKCSEYHFDNAYPGSCYRNGDPEKVPSMVTWIENIVSSDKIKAVLVFRSGRSDTDTKLSMSLQRYLSESFGNDNVSKEE